MEIRTVGRLTRILGTNDAELAVLVSDQFYGRGLGKELKSRLIAVGATILTALKADILGEHRDVSGSARSRTPRSGILLEDEVVKAEYRLFELEMPGI
jgi:acetyltransferase